MPSKWRLCRSSALSFTPDASFICRSKAKRFIKSSACQKVIDAIWTWVILSLKHLWHSFFIAVNAYIKPRVTTASCPIHTSKIQSTSTTSTKRRYWITIGESISLPICPQRSRREGWKSPLSAQYWNIWSLYNPPSPTSPIINLSA